MLKGQKDETQGKQWHGMKLEGFLETDNSRTTGQVTENFVGKPMEKF